MVWARGAHASPGPNGKIDKLYNAIGAETKYERMDCLIQIETAANKETTLKN